MIIVALVQKIQSSSTSTWKSIQESDSDLIGNSRKGSDSIENLVKRRKAIQVWYLRLLNLESISSYWTRKNSYRRESSQGKGLDNPVLRIWIENLDLSKCDYPGCDFILSSRSNFKRHVDIHKVKLFKCDLCDFTSNVPVRLDNHIEKMHSWSCE